MTGIIVDGLKELQSRLDALDRKVVARVVRAALGGGASATAKSIRKAVRRRIGVRTGRLRKAVGSRVERISTPHRAKAKAGINVGRKAGQAPHAHLVLAGTIERATRKGEMRGRIEPSQVVQDAYREASAETRNAMLEKGLKKLQQELAKL